MFLLSNAGDALSPVDTKKTLLQFFVAFSRAAKPNKHDSFRYIITNGNAYLLSRCLHFLVKTGKLIKPQPSRGGVGKPRISRRPPGYLLLLLTLGKCVMSSTRKVPARGIVSFRINRFVFSCLVFLLTFFVRSRLTLRPGLFLLSRLVRGSLFIFPGFGFRSF